MDVSFEAFEYLEYGKPIISSDIKVLREVLSSGQNSLLVPPENLNKWMEALVLVKNNPKLSKKLGRNSKSTAKKYYWEKRAKAILNYNNSLKSENYLFNTFYSSWRI